MEHYIADFKNFTTTRKSLSKSVTSTHMSHTYTYSTANEMYIVY